MTKKLYYVDDYATEFDGTVIACEPVLMPAEGPDNKQEEKYYVILDQTLFFPEEGGQTPDRGVLGGAHVLDVQIDKDVITHTLDKPLEVGAVVHGVIDWNHRFSNMQQHSGEHIFTGFVNRWFGYRNVGFRLSDNVVSMEFDGPLTEEEIARVETAVNQSIMRNLPVTVSYPTKEELATMEYRSKIEIDGQVRIVTIGDVDVCACCAPHVRNTGEIGMLKVMTTQNVKHGVRITILCGFRLLEAMREKHHILDALQGSLTTAQENLPDRVEKLKETIYQYKCKLAEANQKILLRKMEEIPAEQEDVILFEENIENLATRNAVNDLTAKHTGICGIFVGTAEDGYQFIIGSATLDCTKIATALRETIGAKCGGQKLMIQGTVKAEEAVIFEACKELGKRKADWIR